MTTEERFFKKVHKTDSCWLWTAYKQKPPCQPYGCFRYKDKIEQAHRVSFMLFRGEIPNGLFVLHNCHKPSCVNPDHLRLGTQLENMSESASLGRNVNQKKTHCPLGHPLSGENLYFNSQKRRVCISCRRRKDLEYLAKNRKARNISAMNWYYNNRAPGI